MKLSYLVTIFLPALVAAQEQEAKNVYGQPLQPCSSDGMALSGFTRNGYCVNKVDDLGSHHICIDVSSTSGGNFCKVTRQPDWCSSTMPCHESGGLCPVEDWCVCQWAFASYIHNSGGCNHIQNIKCDAVNMHALEAYKRDGRYQEAYKCISQKCGLSSVQVEI